MFASTADQRPKPGLGPESPIPVSRIVRRFKKLVRSTAAIPVWVTGEVIDLRRDSAGNLRFSLQEGGSRITCVMWARFAGATGGALENGLRVAALVTFDLDSGAARVQVQITEMRLAGDGEEKCKLARTRQQLLRDGLLGPHRKRLLPSFPRSIAVITSETGAALSDFIAVARRRHPAVRIVVIHAAMQGDAAVSSICNALGSAQRLAGCEVVCLTRGGGSPADLAPVFNDETLARTIAACRLPVVTAIGHETDTLLVDDVADLRVGTASIAAERIIPERAGLIATLTQLLRAARRALSERVQRSRMHLEGLQARIGRALNERCHRQRARLERVHHRLSRLATARLNRHRTTLHQRDGELHHVLRRRLVSERARLDRLSTAITALDPTRVLARGYAFLSDHQGQVLSNVAAVREQRVFTLRMHDGDIQAIVYHNTHDGGTNGGNV